MTERIVELSEHVDTQVFYGVNNANMHLIKNLHPGIHIVARGHVFKLTGSTADTEQCEQHIRRLEQFCIDTGTLTEAHIINIIKGQQPMVIHPNNLILHGNGGKAIVARTPNQQALVRLFDTNDLLFAIGPAGSGKTYTAIALAVRALKNREIRKMGYNIPPLVNAYMGLSPTMKLFGTAINYGFGDVEETGMLIAVDEILEEKRVRHIDSFIAEHPEALNITSGSSNVVYKEDKKSR